ncbi:MAG: hypothetical protein CVT63_03440 [Candidatus Anoxymicrobium japonicum]|uniref:Crp/Fnr family transcriptional regulator n=1 Tax=Candidatus Anoxymicrobium japonicum TaxID=2013648 RepID=A0A2N3G6G3_9ACTN|nr:MAG: hypothetical protein CVT63_03440 [Candidatus Anoxymicrobium japonicum]
MDKRDFLDEFIGHAKKDMQGELGEKFISTKLDRGQFLFFEGDATSALYLIESGVIEANVVRGDGKVYIFHFVFPGEVLGEGIAYGQNHHLFSAVTRKDAVAWRIAKNDLLRALEADHEFERYIMRVVGEKLDNSYVKTRCIAGERVERRITCILLKTMDESSEISEYPGKLDTPLTNRDISGLIGATEETVSRVMSRLKKKDIIGTRNKQLVVLDRDALIQYFESV